ncbi:mariner Mos1 transposase [Trichonephila clavipes]|nr:mariner Mos1 transposase [Trichonephila clavipes]
MSTYEPNSHHLREVLIFCFAMKKSAAEAHRMLSNTYGEAAISERTCRECFQCFKNGDFDVKGQHGICCQVIYSQFGLAIHQNDHQARRRFVEWAQNEIAVVPDFHKRILSTDEAHFWLNGYVNKQNCRIWSEANPQVYVETPLHPEKLTVWCALWAGGIIGPYFFKNDEGHNVTVNGDRYRAVFLKLWGAPPWRGSVTMRGGREHIENKRFKK